MSIFDRSRLHELDYGTCWSHLRDQQYGVGRLAFGCDPPTLLPVNYLLDVERLVVGTGDGLIADAALRGDRASFETDHVVAGTAGLQTGWSVVATGTLRLITDAQEARYLRLARLERTPGGPTPNLVALDIEQLTGRAF